VEVSSRFTNKIWQAFRFTMGNLEGYAAETDVQLGTYDRWILARLRTATARIRTAIEDFRFDQAAAELYAFTWGELCDWYLEFSKAAIYGDDPVAKGAAQHTLVQVFSAVARLSHPIMPFLSEELWQTLPGTEGSVMNAAYPRPEDYPEDDAIQAEVALLKEAIVALRRLRAEMELPAKAPFVVTTKGGESLGKHLSALKHLAGVESIAVGDKPAAAGTAVAAGVELYVALEGLIDLDAEKERLDGEIAKVQKDLKGLDKKLGNPGFVAKAPEQVVAKFKEKQVAAVQRLAALQAARASL